jgi:hypothetical protein
MKNSVSKGFKYSDTLLLKGSLIPFIYFVLIIGLGVGFLKVGLGKYFKQRALIAKAKTTENVLTTKLNYLKDNQVQIKAQKDLVSIALPEKNPALTILTQIKNLQVTDNIVVTEIRVASGTKDEKGTGSTGFVIKVEGGAEDITGFLGTVLNSLPLLRVNRVEFTEIGGNYTAEISLTSFWEDLPIKIPAVTDPIKKLTSDEVTLVASLQGKKSPEIRSYLPQSPTQRANPFNQ